MTAAPDVVSIASWNADLTSHAERAPLRGETLQAFVRADGDAAVVELSSTDLAHNFGDTLRRHDEGYHDKLHAARGDQARHDGIASAHDRVAFLHEILPGDADPDARPRSLFLEQWTAPDGNAPLYLQVLACASALGRRVTVQFLHDPRFV